MTSKYLQMMEEAAKYVVEEKPSILGPEDAAAFVRPLVEGEKQESLYAFYLNCRNEILAFDMITRGLADRTSCHPREVFRGAILENASRVMLAHNHPSGNPKPSQGDIRSTDQLVEAGKVIGIEVVDHIIVGTTTENRERYYESMRELGYIK